MTPVRQKKIRTLLRSRPSGMTPLEIAEETGIHVANIRTSLRAMPDVYVDRWRIARRGQYEKVWVAVHVPEDCPHPKDRMKWGINTKKPKTQWVITEGAKA
jgi:8-oxo-dGTP pyrophosphatase MutT (NUDIX family)